jgi:hypothetical protein
MASSDPTIIGIIIVLAAYISVVRHRVYDKISQIAEFGDRQPLVLYARLLILPDFTLLSSGLMIFGYIYGKIYANASWDGLLSAGIGLFIAALIILLLFHVFEWRKAFSNGRRNGSRNGITTNRNTQDTFGELEAARQKYIDASRLVAELHSSLFQPGSGYGSPDEFRNDEQRLVAARAEAVECFQDYQLLERRKIDLRILSLERSQTLAAWSSFSVAAVVGAATIVNIVLTLTK